jgi:hypothetical protein
MFAQGQTFYILEDKIGRLQLGNDPNEVANQSIARIVQCPLPDHREALARSAAKYDIDSASPQSGSGPNFGAGQIGDRSGEDGAMREIELMDRTVNWIDFDSGYDVESSLLETEAESPGTGEQIDSNWPRHELSVSLDPSLSFWLQLCDRILSRRSQKGHQLCG